MIFLFIIIGIALLAGMVKGGEVALTYTKHKKIYGVGTKELHTLSLAGQVILKAYNALPAANRPSANMVAIISALDKKNGGDTKVDEHFQTERRDSYGRRSGTKFDPDLEHNYGACYNSHRPENCQFYEYNKILDGLKGIARDLADQQYELEMAGIAGRLGEAQGIIESMATERKLIQDTTRSIKADVRGELH